MGITTTSYDNSDKTNVTAYHIDTEQYILNEYISIKDKFIENNKKVNNYDINKAFFLTPSVSRNIMSKFVPGEFIVKFNSGTTLDLSQSSDSWIHIGIPSLDVINKIYHVTSIEKLFSSEITNDEKLLVMEVLLIFQIFLYFMFLLLQIFH